MLPKLASKFKKIGPLASAMAGTATVPRMISASLTTSALAKNKTATSSRDTPPSTDHSVPNSSAVNFRKKYPTSDPHEFIISTRGNAADHEKIANAIDNLITKYRSQKMEAHGSVPALAVIEKAMEVPRAHFGERWMKVLLPLGDTTLREEIEKLPGVDAVHGIGLIEMCEVQATRNPGKDDSTHWSHNQLLSRSVNGESLKYNGLLPTSGAGAFVYVVDDGILPSHPEFADKSSSMEVLKTGAFDARNKHGTSVASLICGNKFGITRGATLIDVPVDGKGKAFEPGALMEALQLVIADVKAKGRANRTVVNLSMSCLALALPEFTRDFEALLKDMYTAGIFVVASSGNRAEMARLCTPARCHDVLTVGAIGRDEVRRFSNFGDGVDVFAPDNEVRSAINTVQPLHKPLDGTSFAAPLLAGIALGILGRSSRPMPPAELKNVLLAEYEHELVTLTNAYPRIEVYRGEGKSASPYLDP